jgi:hypothetical protein
VIQNLLGVGRFGDRTTLVRIEVRLTWPCLKAGVECSLSASPVSARTCLIIELRNDRGM